MLGGVPGGPPGTQEFIKIYMSCLLARGPLVESFVQISGQGTFWYLGGLWGVPGWCHGEYLGGLRVTQEFIKVYMSCHPAREPLG